MPAETMIGMGILGIMGGLANWAANSSASDRAAVLSDRAFRNAMDIAIPSSEEQNLVFHRFVSTGELDPRMEQAVAQDPSALQNIAASPSYQQAQNRALQELERIGYEGGMTLQDRSNLEDAMRESRVNQRANREGIGAEMARRGVRGGGRDAAVQLASQDNIADLEHQAGLRSASDASIRALRAIEGAGGLAGHMRGQEFGEQAQRATAADRINAFNTQNMRDINRRNIDASNQAAAQGLANRQRISFMNTGLANQELERRANMPQQRFQNQLARAQAANPSLSQQANIEQRRGEQTGNVASNLAQAGIYGLSSMDHRRRRNNPWATTEV